MNYVYETAYRLRHVALAMVAICIVVLFASLVTVFGAHTVIDPSTPRSTTSSPAYDLSSDTNPIVGAGSRIISTATNTGLDLGTTVYSGCHSITLSTQHGIATIGQAFETATGAVAQTASEVVRNVGSAVGYIVHVPLWAGSSLLRAQPVDALIRPATATKETPLISSQTSPDVLALLDARQRQYAATLQAEQVSANQELNGIITTGSATHGGYPAIWDNRAQDSTVDSWGMYNRECVSYAAWKVYQTYGSMPFWGGVGNANQWVYNARSAGISTGYTPRPHAVAISMHGYYGHAMWVEAVDGDRIYVSQYNYDLRGHYSEMWVSSAGLTYIYFGS